jgi:OOP family OmpA-OmpF porin
MTFCDARTTTNPQCNATLRIASLTLLLLTALPHRAVADDTSVYEKPGDSLTTEAGYAWPSRALGTSGRGFTASVIYGHPLPANLALEVNVHASTFETGTPGGTDFYQKGVNLDLAYQFNPLQSSWLNPFVLVGVGGAYDDFNPDTLDRGVFLAEAGLGAISKPLFSNGLRLRLDARWVHDSNEGGHSEYRGMLGVFVPIGWTKPEPPARIEVREVVKEVVRQVPMERVAVDSDGDGIDDARDKCPNTPRGARVDSTGCVIEAQTIELRGVTFNLNKATLTTNAQTVLDTVVPAFTGQPSLHVEIAGHTDSSGSVRYNQVLSQSRAETVRDYLIAHGAHADQVTARGYGKSQLLINPEKSEVDRERNRRVELRTRAQGQQE